MKLSILDQSPIRQGIAATESITETIALSELADRLGYARYWVSEHHNSGSLAGTAPEILMAAIAARTRRIRVGSAGVMLPHYASLKVAEQFRVLEAIAPGRIDLGLGRAPGADMATAMALNPDVRAQSERFGTQVQEVMALLDGQALQTQFAGHTVSAEPRGPTSPEVWILGSSNWGAQAAALLGLPYCFAWFFSDGAGAEEALGLYRQHFRPGPRLSAPHSAICVFAIAADTEAEAWRLNQPREAWKIDRERGRFLPIMSEAAAGDILTALPAHAQASLEHRRALSIVGTAPQVMDRLAALETSLGVDEIALVTATWEQEARRHSYALIAKAAGL
jgi:luciferase family oxidoreductase group 1